MKKLTQTVVDAFDKVLDRFFNPKYYRSSTDKQ